eukprot:118641_1
MADYIPVHTNDVAEDLESQTNISEPNSSPPDRNSIQPSPSNTDVVITIRPERHPLAKSDALAGDSETSGGHPCELSSGPHVNIKRVGAPTRRCPIDLEWTVERAKKELYPEEFESEKKIRIIFNGRPLDDDCTLSASGLKENSFVHVAITNPPIGAPGNETSGSEAEDPESLDAAFLAQLQQEEEWAPREGSMMDFCFGFLLGFIFGPIMFLWVMPSRRIPTRQRQGICFGIATKICLAFMHPPTRHKDDSENALSDVQPPASFTD